MKPFILALIFLTSSACASELITTQDLSRQSQIASSNNEIIVLMLSLTGCPHCQLLRSDILKPWALSGEYDTQVRFVETHIDSALLITDFSGNTIDADEFAKRYRARIAPIVLFLDSDGKQLAEAIIGANNLDMYGYYLDEAIHLALKTIQ